MKTCYLLRCLAVLGSAGLLLAACHHADPDPNPDGCQLTYNDGHDFTYVYNVAGQLTAARTTNILGEIRYDYSYAGSQVTLPVTYGKDSHFADWTLTLNAQGYVARAVNTYWTSQQIKQISSFGYDANGHLTSYRESGFTLGQPATPVSSKRIRLDYQDGDLTQVFDSVSNLLMTFRYGTQVNRNRLPLLLEDTGFCPLQLEKGLLPLAGKPPTHLVSYSNTTLTGSPLPVSQAFTYTLDPNGQATQIRLGGSGALYALTSTCP